MVSLFVWGSHAFAGSAMAQSNGSLDRALRGDDPAAVLELTGGDTDLEACLRALAHHLTVAEKVTLLTEAYPPDATDDDDEEDVDEAAESDATPNEEVVAPPEEASEVPDAGWIPPAPDLEARLRNAVWASALDHATAAATDYERCAASPHGTEWITDWASHLAEWRTLADEVSPGAALPPVDPIFYMDGVRSFYDEHRLRPPPQRTWHQAPYLAGGPALLATLGLELVSLVGRGKYDRIANRRFRLGVLGFGAGAVLGMAHGPAWRSGEVRPLVTAAFANALALVLGSFAAFAPRASEEVRAFGQGLFTSGLANLPFLFGGIGRVLRCRHASEHEAAGRQCR